MADSAASLEFSVKSKCILGKINQQRNQSYTYRKPKQAECLKSALQTDTIRKKKKMWRLLRPYFTPLVDDFCLFVFLFFVCLFVFFCYRFLAIIQQYGMLPCKYWNLAVRKRIKNNSEISDFLISSTRTCQNCVAIFLWINSASCLTSPVQIRTGRIMPDRSLYAKYWAIGWGNQSKGDV